MIFLKLRQATNKDFDTITMIFRKSFKKTIHNFEFPNFDNISEMHISERLSDGSLYAFENGTAVIGGAVFFIKSGTVHIDSIFILPEFFGQGFGARIMMAIEGYEPSIKKLTVAVPQKYSIMMNICKQCGYKETKHTDERVCFEKTLSQDIISNTSNDKNRTLSSYEGRNVRISLCSCEIYEGKCSYLSSGFIFDVFEVDEEGLQIDDNVFFASDINKVTEL